MESGGVRVTTANAEFYLPNYRLGKTLGIGSFGKVKVAEHVLTGHKVAIKILNRKKIKSMDMEEKVRREIKILRLFMHPHIIRLYEVIETPTDIFVVMEYVRSGELFDYIVEKGRLLEDEARRFFQQIISGVEYCHRNMVVHRDLKPENLLLDNKYNVKIADFGLSNIMRDGHFLKTSCGSPNYAAPEVISGKLYAGPEVDVWSCGVILYALLCGSLPFDDENIPNLFKKIKGGIYTLPSHLSLGARDLIPRMLLVDPMKRVTIPEIRQHPWFQAHLPRYLAVPPPDTIQQAKRVDEEILMIVVKLGFDRNQLIEALHNRIQNKATVAYYLLLDNRRKVTNGYLGAEFQEAKEFTAPSNRPSDPMSSTLGRILTGAFSPSSSLNRRASNSPGSLHHRVIAEKKWALGLQSKAHPSDIMAEVLRALSALDISWKKSGLYTLKCRFVAPLLSSSLSLLNPSPTPSTPAAPNSVSNSISASPASLVAPIPPVFSAHSDSNMVPESSSNVDGNLNRLENEGESDENRCRTVKLELQLYKMKEEKYLLDLHRVEGAHFLFLDLCARFLAELRVI